MTEDQQALLEKARASLEAARVLTELKFYDFAVSRAYYAMFYAARSLLLGRSLTSKRHTGVVDNFNQHFVHTGLAERDYHLFLSRSFADRMTADSGTGFGMSAENTRVNLLRAERFLDLAERLIGGNATSDGE